MQIIHITKDLPSPYDVDKFKYGYFIVVFEKPYKELPDTIDALDLMNIYKIKYKPKDEILFISHWDEIAEIKLKTNTIDYDKHSKYEITYSGNIEASKNFNPEIIMDFTMPEKWESNDNRIRISHSPNDINWVFSRIEQEYKL